MSSRLAITQNLEAPLAGPATRAGELVRGTASDFAQLIKQLTSESPSSDSLHPPAATWGQGFGPAAGLPPGAKLHASPGSPGDLVAGVPAAGLPPGAKLHATAGSAGDLVAGVPTASAAPQPETSDEITSPPADQSPEPTADEQVPALPTKIETIEQHSHITAPRQQQKSTPAKTKENTQTAPAIITAPTPAPVPIILKLPTFTPRPATNGSADHPEDSRPLETSSQRTAPTDHAETLTLRPPAALEVTLRSKEQPAQPPVDVASPPQPAPEKTAAGGDATSTGGCAGCSLERNVTSRAAGAQCQGLRVVS